MTDRNVELFLKRRSPRETAVRDMPALRIIIGPPFQVDSRECARPQVRKTIGEYRLAISRKEIAGNVAELSSTLRWPSTTAPPKVGSKKRL